MSGEQWKPGVFPDDSMSASRIADLQWCLRKVYNAIFLSWRGWETPVRSERRREAYVLKKLTSLDVVLANAVHAIAHRRIEALIEDRPLDTLAEIRSELEEAVEGALRTSRARDAFRRQPTQVTMLRSAWYRPDMQPDPNEVARVRDKLERCAQNLITSPVWDTIATLRRDQLRCAEDRGTFLLDGTPVDLRPDAIWVEGQNVTLLDWKTGMVEGWEARRQLAIYAMYAHRKLGLDFRHHELRGWVENLWLGTRDRYAVTAQDLAEAGRWLRWGIAELHRLLEDPVTGEPKPISAFPVAAREQRGYCIAACPYLDLCKRELKVQRQIR
jgi:hypothetical protein